MKDIVTWLQAGCRVAAHQAASLCAVLPGTPVFTASGPTPAEKIIPGTRLITRSGMCRVTAVRRHHLPALAVVVLKANALAPGIPGLDLCLPLGQPVALPTAWPQRRAGMGSVTLRPKARTVLAKSLESQGYAATRRMLEDVVLHELCLPERDYFQAASVQLLSGAGVPR